MVETPIRVWEMNEPAERFISLGSENIGVASGNKVFDINLESDTIGRVLAQH